MARGMLDNLRVKVDEASTLQDPSPLVNSLEKISEYFPGLQQIDTTEDLVGVPAQEASYPAFLPFLMFEERHVGPMLCYNHTHTSFFLSLFG